MSNTQDLQRAVAAARAFLDAQLADRDVVLTLPEYHRHLANLAAAIPPFKKPAFQVLGDAK